MKYRAPSKGFTIIELMIATMVFSVILLVCAAALIQVGRIYRRGVINNQTQEVARSVINSISESIQFTGGSISKIGTSTLCIDNKRYSFILNRKLDDTVIDGDKTKRALVWDMPTGGCISEQAPSSLIDGSAQGYELLSPNMRVLELTVCTPGVIEAGCPTPPPLGSNMYQVNVTIAYGDSDLLVSGRCRSLATGGAFCAVSRLSTTVQRRIIK